MSKNTNYSESLGRQDVIAAVINELGTVSSQDKLKIFQTLSSNLGFISNAQLGVDDRGREDKNNPKGKATREALKAELSEILKEEAGSAKLSKDGVKKFTLDEKKLAKAASRLEEMGNEIREDRYTGKQQAVTKRGSKRFSQSLKEDDVKPKKDIKNTEKEGVKDKATMKGIKSEIKDLKKEVAKDFNTGKETIKEKGVVGAMKKGSNNFAKATLTPDEYNNAKAIRADLKETAKKLHHKLDHLLPGKHSEAAPKPVKNKDNDRGR